jgi:drug/metabolite transporter (DMT)-like permease
MTRQGVGRVFRSCKESVAQRGDVILTCTAVAWAFNISATEFALTHGFSPVIYAASRNLFGGVALAIWVYRREGSLAIRRQDIGAVLGAAALGVTVNQLCLTYSLRFSGAVVVALVFGMGPIATSLIARLARVERLGGWGWIAAILSSGGVACVALGAGSHGAQAIIGIGLALGATLSWAGYSVILMSVAGRYSALRLNAVIILAGSIPLASLATPMLGAVRWLSITPMAWTCWTYGTLISYTLGSITWTLGVRLVGASRASLYNNVQPFLGAILAALLLSERFALIQLLGGGMVAGGVVLGGRGRSSHLTQGQDGCSGGATVRELSA